MVLLQGDFFEADVLFVLEGLRGKDQNISGVQNQISAGNKDLVIALNDSDNDTLRQVELGDLFVSPGIAFCELNFNKMYIFFLSVLAHPLDPGILIYEPRGNNTGRDGDHAHAEECDKDAEQLAQRRDGIDISVSDGQQSGSGPPDP